MTISGGLCPSSHCEVARQFVAMSAARPFFGLVNLLAALRAITNPVLHIPPLLLDKNPEKILGGLQGRVKIIGVSDANPCGTRGASQAPCRLAAKTLERKWDRAFGFSHFTIFLHCGMPRRTQPSFYHSPPIFANNAKPAILTTICIAPNIFSRRTVRDLHLS